MSFIKAADNRVSETPGGVMTTHASPTLGSSTQSIWRVDVKPGVAGPLHDFDSEQIWVFTSGAATVELGEEAYEVAAGDTVVMPAQTPRRITAGGEGCTATVTAAGTAHARTPDGADHGTPPWIA